MALLYVLGLTPSLAETGLSASVLRFSDGLLLPAAPASLQLPERWSLAVAPALPGLLLFSFRFLSFSFLAVCVFVAAPAEALLLVLDKMQCHGDFLLHILL